MKGKKIVVKNDDSKLIVEFNGYIADVTINDKERVKMSYSPDLDIDIAAKKLTNLLIKESNSSKKPSIYSELFPAFGREFKMLVSNILKARV
jgi:hypothetical protein